MNDEQILILNFLRCSPETWFGKKELARRAVRRRVFEENPHWADAHLMDLIVQGFVEEDQNGQVRLMEDERKRKKVSGSPDEAKPNVFAIEVEEGDCIQLGTDFNLLAAGGQSACVHPVLPTRQGRPV